jgi:hypothetical protein
MKHTIKKALIAACASGILFSSAAFAKEWKAVILPASANTDQTIRLISDHTQLLTFTLQADDEITQSAKTHHIVLEFNMPAGLSIAHQQGYLTLTEKSHSTHDDRNIIVYDAQVDNASIIGKPGARISTEWRVQSIFVNTPKSVPPGQNYVQVRVIDGDKTQTFQWPLQLESLKTPKQKPQHTTIGLWSYNYQRAQNAASATGIARFLSDAGINFVQAAGEETYRNALQKEHIVTGGNTHHSLFYKKAYQDISVKGEPVLGNFADPTAIINLPAGSEIPGAKQLVDIAHQGDGIATYDYEPTGRNGFSEAGISAFQKKYNVSEADFKTFREYVAKNGLQTHLSTDPLISKTWKQWTEFRSNTTSTYVRRISEAAKAIDPKMKIAVTPSRSYGANTKSTLALGTDNAAMSQYIDIVMPQIYSGYGAANAKLAMDMTKGWHDEIVKQNAKTQLWPLLLVRYAGASVFNSPQRLYQQAIGSMAQGADGILFYYPGNMDAPYWNMVAQLNEALAQYENYYHNGKRVDEQYKLSELPLGRTEVNMYPGYPEIVENPGWAFTAHQVGSKVLLTLINLEEGNDLVFGINIGKAKVLSTENAVPQGDGQWLVAPRQVAFIVLSRE